MPYDFSSWWTDIGSGIVPCEGDDIEQHARAVAEAAWSALVRGIPDDQVSVDDLPAVESCPKCYAVLDPRLKPGFGHQPLHISTLLALYDQNEGDWLRIVRAVEKAHGVGV